MKIKLITFLLIFIITLGKIFTLTNLRHKKKHKITNKKHNKPYKALKGHKKQSYSYMGGVQQSVVNGDLVPSNSNQVINTWNGLATPSSNGMFVSGGQVYVGNVDSIPYGSGYTFSRKNDINKRK